MGTYRLEFYADDHGDEPVRRWLREELSRTQRLVVGMAMREVLEEEGVNVCGTEFGKQLGGGLFASWPGTTSSPTRARFIRAA